MGNGKKNLYMVSYGFHYYNIINDSHGQLDVIEHDFYPGKSEKEVRIDFERDRPLLDKEFDMVALGYHIRIEDIEKVEVPGYELILKKR